MCMWIYRLLTINTATPRGLRPTGWEPQGRTGLWLMTTRRAWGTSAGLPLLLSSWPSDFLSDTPHSDLFTENIFCINFNKLVMTFHSGKIFFHAKKWILFWIETWTTGRKVVLNSRCTRATTAFNATFFFKPGGDTWLLAAWLSIPWWPTYLIINESTRISCSSSYSGFPWHCSHNRPTKSTNKVIVCCTKQSKATLYTSFWVPPGISTHLS